MMKLMNEVTKGEAKKPKYEAAELPIEKIIPNPGNLYSMEGIDELADSILLAGRVLQNIVVKAADSQGQYMIISGHRRIAACKKLVEGGHAEFGTVPALIENEADENLRELMLIYTNATARILTDAEKMRQAQRATEILKNLKAEGKFEGRIRDAVARMLDTTGAQLARYAAIANNLTNPELKEAFEGGRLGVSAAYEASGLSDKGQEAIADKLADGGAVSIQDVKEAKEQEKPAEVKTNHEGIPMKETKLDLLKKFKAKITILTIEKDGKFYASSEVWYKTDGWGSYPFTERSTPYDTEQEAVEAEIRDIAYRNEELHRVLWESGYHIVDDPAAEQEEAQPPTESKVEAAVAKWESQGIDALTDCEKCKLTTRCEDCCRTCPPEKNCNVRQCEMESKKEKEQIAREQAGHNASITARAKNTEPETEPLAEETKKEPSVSPEVYALTTILNELTALEESYRGAAERHFAINGDERGRENLIMTAKFLKRLISKTEIDLYNFKKFKEEA
ncbi:MAG: ParB N-terminal domain-containing protein [Selenomonadaceae bacterium]|nr:ParB N-terminal domain-containing protein [Selenomonadaceae bacterium]MBR6343462.1 ParB N-terminal domain-containing protein [Selenomonadaceae bacterium]